MNIQVVHAAELSICSMLTASGWEFGRGTESGRERERVAERVAERVYDSPDTSR
jgi:hypothetical protein